MKPILILDFGSQFAHLIGNRIRRLRAHSEIIPIDTPAEEIQKMNPAGIILSGGPQSVFAVESLQPDPKIYDIDVPFLGICYGHQLLAHHYGGKIESVHEEFGKAQFTVDETKNSLLLRTLSKNSTVWMNHGDSVTLLPKDFQITGRTKDCPIAAYENKAQKIYSVQFHPEVTHTEEGMTVLDNFVDICGAKGSWNLEKILEDLIENLQKQIGDKNVFLLVSGGVDSSVAFALLNTAIGADRVYGLFVDHGLMRKDEGREVKQMLDKAGFQNLHVANESQYFLNKLQGLTEPEEKRKAIGDAFLDIQKKVSHELQLDSGDWLLGQGTIYPDHIETGGTKHASKIKTHHNRVPEIERMLKKGLIIEPIADFYKDEVREIGKKLGLPKKMIMRHPFPGPGLGVRILCQHEEKILKKSREIKKEILKSFTVDSLVIPVQSVGVQGDARSYKHPVAIFSKNNIESILPLATKIPNTFSEINRVLYCLSQERTPEVLLPILPAEVTEKRVQILQQADAIVRKILFEHDLQESVWQFPVVLLPYGFKQGTESIILRPIQSENAMTATVVLFTPKVFQQMNDEIIQKIPEISAVYVDLTSKPPGTIEWE